MTVHLHVMDSPAARGKLRYAGLMVSLAIAVIPMHASAFDLVSQAEYEAQLADNTTTFGASAADLQFGAAAEEPSGGPAVEVLSPDPLQPLAAPINIDIRFHTDNNSQVDVSTFRVLYGMLKLDVTRKLLSAPGVVVTATGIRVSGAQLPKGKHRFLIEVADRAGRVGRRLLEVSVVG